MIMSRVLTDLILAVAAGVDLGYSLTRIVGLLANRSDLQQNGYKAIQEVYNGEPCWKSVSALYAWHMYLIAQTSIVVH